MTYTITDLGALTPTGINDFGQIVGNQLKSPGVEGGFLYVNGILMDLGSLGQDTHANALNNFRQVTGFSLLPPPVSRGDAFLYSFGRMIDLGCSFGNSCGAEVQAQGLAINNAGLVTGYANTGSDLHSNGNQHAFLYNGRLIDIGALLAGPDSRGTGMNAAGQIVGFSTAAVQQGFLYQNGTMQSLGAYVPVGIDDLGDIAANTSTGAFLLRGGNAVPLGSPSGGPIAINARGDVVGSAPASDGSHAWVYRDGVLTDLTTIITPLTGWQQLQFATGINNAGQIVGTGLHNGVQSGFLLTPVGSDSCGSPDSPAVNGRISCFGGVLGSRPVVGTDADGRLEVFVHGSDHSVWHTAQTVPGGSWSAWAPLGGSVISNIAVARNADGRLEIFALGTDNGVWHRSQVTAGSTSWGDWTTLGGYATTDPAVAVNADGRLEVVVRGSDLALWDNSQATAGGGWSGWTSLGGVIVANPALASNSDGTLEAFVVGTDNGLWHARQVSAGGAWSGWSGLGGSFIGDPAVAANQDGSLAVFGRGIEASLLYAQQNGPGGAWGSWSPLGGALVTNAAPIRNSDGTLDVS